MLREEHLAIRFASALQGEGGFRIFGYRRENTAHIQKFGDFTKGVSRYQSKKVLNPARAGIQDCKDDGRRRKTFGHHDVRRRVHRESVCVLKEETETAYGIACTRRA